jgi:hypothetical protein
VLRTVYYGIQVLEFGVLNKTPQRFGGWLVPNPIMDGSRANVLLLDWLWIKVRAKAETHDMSTDVRAGMEALQASRHVSRSLRQGCNEGPMVITWLWSFAGYVRTHQPLRLIEVVLGIVDSIA